MAKSISESKFSVSFAREPKRYATKIFLSLLTISKNLFTASLVENFKGFVFSYFFNHYNLL